MTTTAPDPGIEVLRNPLRDRGTEPRRHVTYRDKLKTPDNLARLHAEVATRWGVIDLLDFLKESDFVTDFTNAFTTVATREATPREVIPQAAAAGAVRAGHQTRSAG